MFRCLSLALQRVSRFNKRPVLHISSAQRLKLLFQVNMVEKLSGIRQIKTCVYYMISHQCGDLPKTCFYFSVFEVKASITHQMRLLLDEMQYLMQ